MRFLSVSAVFLAFSAFAGIEQAPPNFSYSTGKAVYIDIESAHYSITYDVANESAKVESELVFTSPEKGFPIFDLVPSIQSAVLDGASVATKEIADPDKASKLRVIDAPVSAGKHTLKLTHEIDDGVSFKNKTVSSSFWMSDLSDRQYLEQYLPTNLEFDQVAMTMDVEVVGSTKAHVLRANGNVTELGQNRFRAVFPAKYTTSSVYFHVMPVDAFPTQKFDYASVDGRTIPVDIYTAGNLKSYVDEAKKVLAELESDYGAFPHNKVIIYGAGSGGMEYSGATVTSVSALGHELFHSYNARGVMPAQGNAGWIDEAMSSWRDAKYAIRSSAGARTRMAGHSVYTRMTDSAAYTSGKDFLSWIAGRMENRGQSFKSFLRDYFAKNMFSTRTTETFRADLEKYSGLDLQSDFKTYIYGARGIDAPLGAQSVTENPFHPRLSRAELDALLWP